MSAISGPVSPGQRYNRGAPCPVCGGYDTLRRGRGVRCSGYYSSDGKVAFCTREEYAGDLAAPIAGAPLPTWAHYLAGRCKCGTDHAHQAPAARPLRAPRQAERRGYAGPPRQGETPYTYVDEAGNVLFQVRRVPSPEGGKTFYQVHYEQARGGWVYGRGAAPLVLYRLPEIADASPDTPIWFTEGEKCADALARLGLVATCNAGGALKNADAWQPSYSAALQDRPVIILQDNDMPGQRHAEIARNALYGIARRVTVIPPLGAAPGYDVADWLAEGNGKEQLLALAERTPAWAPETGEALLSLYISQHAEQVKAGALASAYAAISAPLAEIALAEREALLCDLARLLLDYTTRAIDTLRAAPVPLRPERAARRDLLKGERGRTLRAMLARLQRAARRAGLLMQTASIEIAWREALQSLERAIARAPRQAEQGAENAREPGAAPGGAAPLVSVAAGDIYLTPEGFYLQSARRGRLLLGAPVRVLRVARGAGNALYLLEVCPPEGAPVRISASLRAMKEGTCWTELDTLVSPLPVSESDCASVCSAIRALAKTQGEVQAIRRVPALAWQEHEGRRYWVAVNGAISAERVYTGDSAPLRADMPPDYPQTLPEVELPAPSAAPLATLLDFWAPEESLFSVAMLGACAEVSKPARLASSGRLNWQLEIFGQSNWHKTTFINHTLGAFFGAGYTYDTPAQIAEGLAKDTGIGLTRLRASLAYHAYLDIDMNAHPGAPDYDRQQERRLALLNADGNAARGGAKSNREGDLLERPTPGGLMLRAGECSPYDYTVARHAESADARAMTFLLVGDHQGGKARRLAYSIALTRERALLHSLSIAWRQYLARQEDSALIDREITDRARLAVMIDHAEAREGANIHDRARGQLQDVGAGILEYARFLRSGAIIQGAEIAERLLTLLPELIAERVSHAARLAARHAEGGATPEESQAEQALHAIRSLLYTHAHLLGRSGGAPEEEELAGRHASLIGWRVIGGELRPQGVAIGWIDSGRVYLIPSVLCDLLQDRARLAISAQRLREMLEATGAAISSTQKGKHKGMVKRGPMGAVRCLALRLDALLPPTSQGEPEEAEAGEGAEIAGEIAQAPTTHEPPEQEVQAPEIAQAPTSNEPGAATVTPPWYVGKPWYDARRADGAASQALEWACPSIPVAAQWLTTTVKEAFTTGAPLAGVTMNGRAVSPDRFLTLLRQAYAENGRGMLAYLARSVGG